MVAILYDWDPVEDNVAAEYDGAGAVQAEYFTEPYLYGDIKGQRQGGQSNYFYSDGLGSTTEVTDDTNAVVATRAYSAFGETTETSGSLEFPYQWIGRRGYEAFATYSAVHIRRRQYSFATCRWTSFDPIGTTDGINPYVYVGNSPTYLIDPSGLSRRDPNPGDGCQWERHHWFPRELRSEIESKCARFGFNIDIFTTSLRRCWGRYEECDAHGWLHYRRRPQWNPHVGRILRRSKSCCQFLVAMFKEINAAYYDLIGQFDTSRCASRGQGHDARLEYYHFSKTNSSPELSQCTPIQTTILIGEILAECKRGRNVDTAVKMDLKRRVEELRESGGGLQPDPIPDIIFGAGFVGVKCLPLILRELIKRPPPGSVPRTPPRLPPPDCPAPVPRPPVRIPVGPRETWPILVGVGSSDERYFV